MFRLLISLLPILLVAADPVPTKTYKIASLINPPYLQLKDDQPGNYEGFVVDLAEAIKVHMPNSVFEILLAPDQRYGQFNPETQKWSGVVGQLVDGNADIAITDLTITDLRSTAVDFSTPIVNTGISIVYSFPETNNILFSNFEELVNQDAVKYGIVRHGSTHETFKNSEDPIFQKAFKYFECHPELLVANNEEGVKRVVAEAGNYAFVGEVTLFNKWLKTYPQLAQIGGIIVPRQYGLALPKNSDRLERLNQILKTLTDDGTLAKLKERWLIKDN